MSTSSTTNGNYIKFDYIDFSKTFKSSKKSILEELHIIVKEKEEDKEKYLPIFNPEDLDL